MADAPVDPGPAVRGYHAHVYYDAATRELAARLRDELAARFAVRLGRWHDVPVGPHTAAMYQVAFEPEELARLLPWLMLNRGPLAVLLHPETGDELPTTRRTPPGSAARCRCVSRRSPAGAEPGDLPGSDVRTRKIRLRVVK